ncbi:hypothetical protein EVG20_g550 [Dentipellis fragilis]|uniref:Transcription factor IIIC 90kDa subunit N-terminal domain-containing protein n=1 Tax=Dentipellis fragilis TaxID=205917 RepID=A0A4Y9ZCE2_9AGAM|nr:hypothetical protein EVG20_g550 [Dentipellis fragilis]
MSHVPVYTALSIPVASSFPSVNCLQWTSNGQIIFVAKNAIYILTPDPGINFDSSSTVKSPQVGENEAIKPLDLFRTVIECDRVILHHWPSESQEWGSVALGSLDISLRSVTASPGSLTADGRCLLAVLNSNLELSLWGPVKNHLKGRWDKLQDITSFLKTVGAGDAESEIQRLLQAQTVCASWSTQADFSVTPSPDHDGSLLAVGNRAGSVVFLRLLDMPVEENYFEHTASITVTKRWVNHLAWSPWSSSGSNKCTATLACGSSDGSVMLIDVVQTLVPDDQQTAFQSGFSVEHEVRLSAYVPECVDDRGITGMSWIDLPKRQPILVFCKAGTVHLWSRSMEDDRWSGSRHFRLRTQKVSAGSSFLYPVSGIEYFATRDVLVVTLSDGTLHVVYQISTDPVLDLSGSHQTEQPTSLGLSNLSRTVFTQTEGSAVPKAEINHISGFVAYDKLSTVAWIQEGSCPSDFSYKHDAKHNSVLVVTELWDEHQDDRIITMLTDALITARAARGEAPLHILRPLFLHLRNPGALERLHSHMLTILEAHISDEALHRNIPAWIGELDEAVRTAFRKSLVQHLFGSDDLLSLRLRLATADFCWKYAPTPQAQGEYGAVAQGLLNSISHRIRRTLVRHLSAVTNTLRENDTPFVLRVVIQSLLAGSPPELQAEAQALSSAVAAVGQNPEFSETSTSLEEKCPACGVNVPLHDMYNADMRRLYPEGVPPVRSEDTRCRLRLASTGRSQLDSAGTTPGPCAGAAFLVIQEFVSPAVFCTGAGYRTLSFPEDPERISPTEKKT